MATPLVFDNTTYLAGYFSFGSFNTSTSTFNTTQLSPQTYYFTGTINQPGDSVFAATAPSGTSGIRLYATSFDDSNNLLLNTNAAGTGSFYMISNSPIVNGSSKTFSEAQLGDYSVVCFASGTAICTTLGEVAVENLRVGDIAVTSSGDLRPIRWIGHRTIDCSRHPDPVNVQPVRIAAGALVENKPERDLVVSPGHAICLDILGEVLIPASALINGNTITQEHVEEITYWHVELDSNDILIANGQLAESYLDVGNRSFFAGENVVDPFAAPDPIRATAPAYCRPCFSSGAIVQAVHARLRDRARALGWSLEEPLAGLRVVVDGREIQPDSDGLAVRFIVPADAQDVRLVSSTGVPKHLGENDDGRTLGVCLKSLTIEDGLTTRREVALDDPRLSTGFYMAEEGRRWTNGVAHLPRELWQGCRGHFFLRLTLVCPPLPRWKAPAAKAEAAEPHWNGLQLVKAA